MKRKIFISSLLVIGFTLPILAILAINQFNWLQVLTVRERKRIQSNMITNASGISDKLIEEIMLLPSMLTMGIYDGGDPTTSCSRQLRAWKNYAKMPEILREVYLTRDSDKTAFLVGYDGLRQVTGSEIPGHGPPIPFHDGTDSFTLWVPLDPGRADRYAILCVFDKTAVFSRLIPAIARESLMSKDLYAYRILDNRDNSVLFASEEDIEPQAFDNPDCRMPLLRDDVFPMMREPALFGRRSFFPYLEIQIVNRQESLAEMTRHSTAQNALFSFGIVALLVVAMGILAEASRKAGQIATKQQEFIATVTHELKTPLAVIVSAAQNLSDGLVRDDERIARYGNAIGKEAARLSASIEHFLLYSNTGTQCRMKLVPCDIGEIIGRAIALTEQECADKGLLVYANIPGEPIFVDGDPMALESVFRNLVENALRHAHEGKILHILVGEELSPNSSRRCVVIKFQDKGPGISRKELRSVFEPFYRGKRARSGQVPGNGIGLNLVRRIVKVHGGTVSVESKVGQGSTFIVKLPQGGGDNDGNQNSDDRG